MKNLLMLALALVALGTTTTLGLAQEPRAIKIDSTMPVQPRIPALTCCECLGKVTTLNLSTGQGSPIDPIWKLNGNAAAYTTPPFSGWLFPSNPLLTPAKWIQPVPSPTPSSSVSPGIYKYSVQFHTPHCVIPNSVSLDVYFAADNGAKVFLDNVLIPTTLCQGTCFKGPQAPVYFTAAVTAGTSHTLEFELTNDSLPASGLIVNAKLTRHCVRGTSGPGSQPTEPNN